MSALCNWLGTGVSKRPPIVLTRSATARSLFNCHRHVDNHHKHHNPVPPSHFHSNSHAHIQCSSITFFSPSISTRPFILPRRHHPSFVTPSRSFATETKPASESESASTKKPRAKPKPKEDVVVEDIDSNSTSSPKPKAKRQPKPKDPAAENENGDANSAPKSKRQSKPKSTPVEGSSNVIQAETTEKPKRKPRKKSSEPSESDAIVPAIAVSDEKSNPKRKSKPKAVEESVDDVQGELDETAADKPKRKPRKKSTTPSESESAAAESTAKPKPKSKPTAADESIKSELDETTDKPKRKPRKKSTKPAENENESASPVDAAEETKPKRKSKPKVKKSDDIEVENVSVPQESVETSSSSCPTPSSSSEPQNVGEIYQKKTQREHILHRPETYVGSMQRETSVNWVYDDDSGSIEQKEVTFVPSLLHIVDEILVNAADNRHRDTDVAHMKEIKVTIDEEEHTISIYNDGSSIPIELHPKEKIYIPELIFFHLLTSSNYNDNERRLTGGRHGYGAKLTNIFSNWFQVEIQDVKNQCRYRQRYSQNMTVASTPIITPFDQLPASQQTPTSLASSWTKITFQPDLKRFDEKTFTPDTLALLNRRVYDIAACVSKEKIKVYLNDQLVPVQSFQAYLTLFPEPKEGKFLYSTVNDQWQVAVGPNVSSYTGSIVPRDISFVNCIATTRGGTHVQHVADKLAKHLMECIQKHHKGLTNVTTQLIKQHMSLFVNCSIPNPSFDSQTKDILLTPPKQFGSVCEFSDKFLNQVARESGIVESVVESCEMRQRSELSKKTRVKKGKQLQIAKLNDANWAGTDKSKQCTLILTEGDSAKALVLAGLSVLGRDKFGVFPLKGKLLNVRDASTAQVLKNEELQHIFQIVGLDPSKSYPNEESKKDLRYGRIMLMTDQDHDGSHIKGLFINMMHKFWPNLLQNNGFLEEFVTAIVKATKGLTTQVFNTIPEYQRWSSSLEPSELSKWRIKYYKGLGTNTAEEGKEYFKNIGKHRIVFIWGGDQDTDYIHMAFAKEAADRRKEWLTTYNPSLHVDHSEKQLTYSNFVNKELILFSRADNIRSIPSVLDGLKPVQRKVLYACFKRNLTKEIKVAQLSGYVSEQTGYHHGEASLHATIVNMAQDFVGANNIPLLVPSGQFGTRHLGGKDAASARYIFTRLAPLTRHLFPSSDDPLLTQKDEDGVAVEPEWYIPIIPIVLVNGAEGIGTGFSTTLPKYKPQDIIRNLRLKLSGQPMLPIEPWTVDYNGPIQPNGDNFTTEGVIKQINETTLEIIELPLGKWSQDYKEFLVSLINSTDAKVIPIKRFSEYHTNEKVRFVIELKKEELERAVAMGLTKAFKLTASILMSNIHLFDPNGVIKKYSNPLQIIEDYYTIRLDYYVRRRSHLIDQVELSYTRSSNRMKFIDSVINGTLIVYKKKKIDIMKELFEKQYVPATKLVLKEKEKANAKNGDKSKPGNDAKKSDKEKDAFSSLPSDTYDYLLNMPLSTLTQEKLKALQTELTQLQSELSRLHASTPSSLWLADLDGLELALKTKPSTTDEQMDQTVAPAVEIVEE